MLAHQVSITQAEGRMIATQGYQVAVVFEHLRIALLVAPIETVDAVGRLKAVVNTLFGT